MVRMRLPGLVWVQPSELELYPEARRSTERAVQLILMLESLKRT